MRLIPSLLLALVLASGCSKKKDSAADTVSCDAVGARALELMQGHLQGLEGRQRRIIESQLQLVRDGLVSSCKQNGWPASGRTCLTQAKNLAELTACADAHRLRPQQQPANAPAQVPAASPPAAE